VALVEKKENSLSLFGEFGKILASVTVPYSKASQWVLSPVATKFEESKIEDLERTLSASALSEKRGIKGVIEGLISSGRIIVVPGSLTHPPVPGKDLNRPVARNALKSEAGVDALKVSGPHFRQAGSLAGSLRGIDPQPIGANYSSKWLPSNFYIEASHNVNEACIEGVDLAKDISQATQAVMNSIGRRLAEESLSFRDVYFASLIIPSMSFFGEMNPVYSSYFVPTQNPPSRVTVAQQPRHSQKISASSSASPSVQPSIRVQFWGLHPKLVNPSIESSLALSPDSFAAHNVLHVESYSGWAPACIGPYSQAHEVLGVDHMAGQIALEPTSMVLQAPSIPNDQSEAYIFERTLVELKLALKHVYSLVKARCSVSIGIAKTSMPSHLLFSSMYTSVPIDMAIRCIQKLESEGTKEEQETVALVLRGATLLKVDQLPRLAAVEIQTIVDSPDSPMYSPTNSNLIIHNAEQVEKGLIKEGSRLSSVQTSHPTLNVPITVETRRSISRSRSFAHFQLAVYGSKDTRWDGKSLGEFLSGLAFPQILASLGLSSQPSSSSSSSDFPQALLSAELFYPINIEDEDANAVMYSVRNSIHAQNIDITPCAALELSSYGWDNTMTTPDRECKAVLHAKFALTMEIDD
jgi:enamine deaminase RidA (YjgF/YER057c/UK114 family)